MLATLPHNHTNTHLIPHVGAKGSADVTAMLEQTVEISGYSSLHGVVKENRWLVHCLHI